MKGLKSANFCVESLFMVSLLFVLYDSDHTSTSVAFPEDDQYIGTNLPVVNFHLKNVRSQSSRRFFKARYSNMPRTFSFLL